jgi:cytochrome c556
MEFPYIYPVRKQCLIKKRRNSFMKKIIFIVAASCILLAAPLAMADLSAINSAVAEYKAASQDLVKLYDSIKTAAEDKAADAQESALMQKQKAAEEKFGAAMQKVDHNNPQEGKAVEKAFGEIQKANEAVGNAHERMMQRKAANAQKN